MTLQQKKELALLLKEIVEEFDGCPDSYNCLFSPARKFIKLLGDEIKQENSFGEPVVCAGRFCYETDGHGTSIPS